MPKSSTKAKQKAKAPRVRNCPDRSMEHQMRWIEDRLRQLEGENSIAFKTWEIVKSSEKDVMKEREAEFLTNYYHTGDFKFVTALKWNQHIMTEELDQNRGTEAIGVDNGDEAAEGQGQPGQTPLQPRGAWLQGVPCRICKFVLNGADQYQDHLKGKRHRKNLKQLKAKESSSVRPASPSTRPRKCVACGDVTPANTGAV